MNEVKHAISKEIGELVGYVFSENFHIDEFNGYYDYLGSVIDFSMRNKLIEVEVSNGFMSTLDMIAVEVFAEYKAGNLTNCEVSW